MKLSQLANPRMLKQPVYEDANQSKRAVIMVYNLIKLQTCLQRESMGTVLAKKAAGKLLNNCTFIQMDRDIC